MRPTEAHVVVACADNRLYEFDVLAKDLTAWSKKNSHRLPRFHMEKREVLQAISFNPERPDRAVLHAQSYFCLVDFSKKVPKDENDSALLVSTATAAPAPATGKRKKAGHDKTLRKYDKSKTHNFYYVSHYKPMLYAGFCAGDELVRYPSRMTNPRADTHPAHTEHSLSTH